MLRKMELFVLEDCGSTDGIILTSRIESGEVVEDVSERAWAEQLSPVLGQDGT